MIEELQSAILAKDRGGVVQSLAGLSETDREALHEPLLILFLALGLDRGFVTFLNGEVNPDDPAVLAKRKADGIQPMSRRDRDYDYDLAKIAWLAGYGVVNRDACHFFPCVPDLEAESAQIMADRRPPWLGEWLTSFTKGGEESLHDNISVSFWSRLYAHGLVDRVDEDWVELAFSHNLPQSFASAPEATKLVLREVPSAVAAIYRLFENAYALFNAKEWTDVLQFAAQEGLLDHGRFLSRCMDSLYGDLNQTERNGCVVLARATSHRKAKCPPPVLAKFQSTWVSLLSDPQAAVAGFGLEQLVAVEKAGLLDATPAVAELPHIFQHKPKNHALKAIRLLDRLGQDNEIRTSALSAVVSALSHVNKDVQAAGLDVLEQRLQSSDLKATDQLADQLDLIAATLQPRLQSLIESLGGGHSSDEATSATGEAAPTLEALYEKAGQIPEDVRKLFRVDAALEAAEAGQLAPCGCWRMSAVRVLDHQSSLQPIETVEQLFELTAAAVERCESADLPDQIVDGIMRLGRQRPPEFEALKAPLAKRACGWAMERPHRGIVGGVPGGSFSYLIRAWLSIETDEDGEDEDDEEEEWFNDSYPLSPFVREVADVLQQGSPYPLLSTPTHSGGWIDPVQWVTKLLTVDENGVKFLESDLIRSLLRLAPDRRQEAFQLATADDRSLSDRLLKLLIMVLDLETPNARIAVDDSWSPAVWMAAIRSRDPWIDLENELPPDELAQIDPELWKLPDVLKPCDYQWRPKESARGRFMAGDLVNSQPMPGEESGSDPQQTDLVQHLLSGLPGDVVPDDLDNVLERLGVTPPPPDGGFLTAQLNRLPCYPAPQYLYPYLATHWPVKLDWYWNLATVGLSRRVESGPSVEERYDQFLLPLFETDRSLTRMAGRALWIATTSKDSNARGMATEVWIALIADDRCPWEELNQAWQDVAAGGWMKLNRVADVLSDVAAAGPLHVFVLAQVLEGYLAACDGFPRDIAKLLELLDECNQRLGRAVPQTLQQALLQFKSGKAKKLSKSLLQRVDTVTADRAAAVVAAVEARVQRAERNRTDAA